MATRRSFVNQIAMLGAGGYALLRHGNYSTARAAATATGADAWPEMSYRTLGRTGFNASRLVYGCGAALSKSPADHLLNLALEKGVNVFDVGYSAYYGKAEQHLAPFIRSHRDNIFVISKAPAPVRADADEEVSVEDAKRAAATWTQLMNQSLSELGQEHVDAYYVMGSNNPSLISSDEIRLAFEAARDAGKVTHLGVSSHENAQNVLAAAVETGWYDLAMIAITPAGWYDWNSRSILEGTADIISLGPRLDAARDAGVALVGMKAGRLLAGRWYAGGGNAKAFNRYYDEKLLQSDLTDFQRSYAYVLEHGLDVVNADIQNFGILEQNFKAAALSAGYFA